MLATRPQSPGSVSVWGPHSRNYLMDRVMMMWMVSGDDQATNGPDCWMGAAVM